MKKNADQYRVEVTPRAVPLAAGLLTLLGALAWDPVTVVLGLAVVGLWSPTTRALTSASEKLAEMRPLPTVASALRTPPE